MTNMIQEITTSNTVISLNTTGTLINNMIQEITTSNAVISLNTTGTLINIPRIENNESIELQFINEKCIFSKGIALKLSKIEFNNRINIITGYDKDKKVFIDNTQIRGWIGLSIN